MRSRSQLIIPIILPEILVELIDFLDLQRFLDSYSAQHIDQRKDNASCNEMREKGKRGCVMGLLPEVSGHLSARKVANLTT